jgi:putative NADH-flavin reductase
MKRNVLVFGATGKTGSLICKELDSKNIPYSVFVRKESVCKVKYDSSKIIQGDVMNTQDVENSFKGAVFTDVIISLGSKKLRNTDIRSKGSNHIVEAMKNNESEANIHIISALGVGDSRTQVKWYVKLFYFLLLKSVMNDHENQELLIQNSTFLYHFLRPVGLKDGPSKGKVHVQNEGFLPGNYIQRADVAKYLVESMSENKTGISAICNK